MARARVAHLGGLTIWFSVVAAYIDGVGLSAILSDTSRVTTLVDQSSQSAHLRWLALLGIGYLAMFVVGVTAASLIRQTSRFNRQTPSILIFTAFLVMLAVLLLATGHSQLMFLVVAAAIGSLNATVESSDNFRFGLLFAPATLTRLGQGIADINRGSVASLVPHMLLLVTSAIGAIMGVMAYIRFGVAGLVFAIAAILIMVIAAGTRTPDSGCG